MVSYKLVNFIVKNFRKTELFDFADTCPWSGDVMPSFCPTQHLWAIFSCEGAALEVLMYVCLSVCQQFEIFWFQKVPEVTCSYSSLHAVTVACMQLQ